jgi:hypothetical protein
MNFYDVAGAQSRHVWDHADIILEAVGPVYWRKA